MADSVANLLLRFASESDPAKRDIAELIAALKVLEGTDAEAEGTVKVNDGGLAETLAALRAFGNEDQTATVDVRSKDALGKIRELHTAFEEFVTDARKPQNISLGDIDGEIKRLQKQLLKLQTADLGAARGRDTRQAQRGKVLADMNALQAVIEELQNTDPTAHINKEIEKAESRLSRLQATLASDQGAGKRDAKRAKTISEINKIRELISQLEKSTPRIDLDADIAKAAASLDLLKRKRDSLKKDSDVEVFADKDLLKIADAFSTVKKLQARLQDLKKVDPQLQLDADIQKVLAQIALKERALEKLNKPRNKDGSFAKKDPLLIADAEADLARLNSRLQRLQKSQPKLKLAAEVRKVNTQLDLAKRSLQELQKGAGSTGTPKDILSIANAIADVDKMEAKLNRLNRLDPDLDLQLKTENAEAQLSVLQEQLKSIDKEDIDVELKTRDLTRQVGEVTALLGELKSLDPEVNIQLKIEKAVAQYEVLQARLRSIDSLDIEADLKTKNIQNEMITLASKIALLEARSPTLEIDLKINDAQSKIAVVEAALASLTDEDILVELKTAKLKGQLAALKAELLLLGEQKVNVEVDVDRNNRASSVLASITRKFSSFATSLGLGGEAAAKASSGISRLGVNLGGFSARLSPLVGVILAVVAAIGGSLVVALATVASAAAFATAAIGALATALAAAAGPAVAVLIAGFTRLAAVWKAVTAAEKAGQAGQKKTEEGMRAAAQAAEERRQAGLRVADALRSVGTAERGVQEAEENAAEAITAANESMANAARGLERANRQVAEATVDAYADMKKAVQDVEDAMLSLEGTKIGIEDASLETRQAVLDLKELRGELGAVGKGMESAFEKFTNVDFDFTDLKSALASVGGGGAASNLTEQQSIDLEKAILRVRKAKLSEKEATNDQEKAETTLAEARRKNIQYQKEGIAAYGPLTAAIESQQDAARSLAAATREANKLNEDGVRGAPAVIAAYEALANARRNYTESLRQRKIVAAKTVTTPQEDEAKRQRDDLSDPERQLADTIARAKQELRGFFAPATIALVSAVDRAIQKMPGILNPLRSGFNKIGAAFAGSLDAAMGVLSDPKNADALKIIVDGAARLVELLGQRVFKDFLQIFIDIAAASMPQLLKTVKGLADGMARFAQKTGNAKELSGFLGTAFGALSSFGKLLGAVARLLFAFFASSVGEGGSLIDMFTGLVNKLADFLQSAGGKNQLKKFFKDVIPLAVAFGKLLGQVLVLFFQAIQVIAPALTGVITVLADFIGIINIVVHALLPFLQVVTQIAFFFFGFFLKAIKAAIIIIGVLASIFPGVYAVISKFISDLLSKIPTLGEAWDWVKQATIDAWEWIKGAVSDGVTFIGNILKTIFKVYTLPWRLAFSWIKTAATTSWNWIKTAFTDAVAFVGKIIAKVFDKMTLPFRLAWKKIKEIWTEGKDWIVKAAGDFVSWISTAFNDVKNAITKPFTDALDFIESLKDRFIETGSKILKWLGEGIKNAPKAIWNGFKSALGKLGDLLPSSEPKDKSSPLTGLKKRGTSIFDQLAEGFDLGSRNMSIAMQGALSPVIGNIETTMPNPAKIRTMAPALQDTGTHIEKQEINLPEQIPGEGYDPKIAAIDLSRELRRRR